MEKTSQAKTVIETTETVVQGVVDIWQILPLEVTAYILTMFTASILMQWVKKTFLSKKTKQERLRLLWSYSFPLGICLAILGYYISDDNIHLGYWVVIGLTVSTMAMGVHKISIDFCWPALKIVFVAVGNRVYIVITGKPREHTK